MKEESLIIGDTDVADFIPITPQTEEKTIYCLNCGTEVNDNFCPHCGQSRNTPSKLKMKNFGKSVLMSFARLTPGFLNTAKGLLFQPWNVVRDHIHGRHVPYSPPITMLIQIFLYATIIYACFDAWLGTDLAREEGWFGYQGDNPVISMMDHSIVVATFLAGIPICFSVYVAYYRHGSRRFNFAEYLAAFFYLFAAINLWDVLLTVLNVIPGLNFDFENLIIIIIGYFCVITLLKAFPQDKWWKSAALLFWCAFVMIIGIMLLGLLMVLPRII